MNQNFVGAPDREDLRVLDQMRRQLLPMIAVMDKLKVEMEFRMSRGETVDWPQIHRTTSLVTNYITSFNTFMHGGYKHSSISTTQTRQVVKQDDAGHKVLNEDGTPVLVSKEVPMTTYSDTAILGQAERVRALHPFPMPPFPMIQGSMPGSAAGLANTLLRKRLEPKEDQWVEDRVRKASEFAHVPGEWEIEPKRADSKDEKEDNDSDDDEGDDTATRLPTKRVQGTLGEDDILDLWKYAHQLAFDHQYLKSKYPEEYGQGYGDGEGDEEGETPGDEGESEEEEDGEFEDVMDTSGAPETSAAPVPAQASNQPEASGSGPVVALAAASARPAVHQPVPGAPMLSLGFVHKFMSTGQVS